MTCISDYNTRLVKLNLLQLMYSYNLYDIKSINEKSIRSFQNPNFQQILRLFYQLEHVFLHHLTSKEIFTSTDHLELDLTKPFHTIETQILWKHFMKNFNSDNLHSLHFSSFSICSKHPNFAAHNN